MRRIIQRLLGSGLRFLAGTSAGDRKKVGSYRPWVEPFEDRCLPAALVFHPLLQTPNVQLWDFANNWVDTSGNRVNKVPTSSDDVLIPEGYTAEVNAGQAHDVEMASGFSFLNVNGSLTVSGDMTVNEFDGVQFTFASKLNVSGVLDNSGGTISMDSDNVITANTVHNHKNGEGTLGIISLHDSATIYATNKVINNASITTSSATTAPVGITLNVNGDYVQSSTGSLRLRANDTSSDELSVTGKATLAGNLYVDLRGGTSPKRNQVYTVVVYNAYGGGVQPDEDSDRRFQLRSTVQQR
jgi:hypothetical protein